MIKVARHDFFYSGDGALPAAIYVAAQKVAARDFYSTLRMFFRFKLSFHITTKALRYDKIIT